MFKNEYPYGKAVNDNLVSEFNEKFEKAFDDLLNELEQDYPVMINGEEIF